MTDQVVENPDTPASDPTAAAVVDPAPQLLTDPVVDPAKAGDDGNPAAPAEGDGAGDGTSSGDSKESTAPETYADFQLPEGVTIDAKILESMTSAFKESGLSQEQAQAVITAQAGLVKASEEASVAAFNQLMHDWVNQAKADKEIGGDAWDENLQSARNAIQKFGTPELGKLLNDYGIGSHPELIRVFTRIGKLLKEDRPGSGSASQPQKDRAEILYGTD